MATTDTLCFGRADSGVAGNPTIDGLTDYDMLPYNGTPEVGYTMGCKYTYAGGAFPRVVFQGVHVPSNVADDARLVLGFMCRFDVTFDEDEFIVILFRQSAGSNAGPRRMILIQPNRLGLGADTGTGDPMFPGYEIKRNGTPHLMHFYKESGGAWIEHFPSAPIEVKVRSWKPGRFVGADPECCWSVEVSVPRTPTGDWITLNDDFGIYFNLAKTDGIAMTVAQTSFPTTNAPMNDFPGENYPNPTLLQWGHGLVPAQGSPNIGVGVHFINGWQGIGRRQSGTAGPLTGTIEGPGVGGTDNELVAQVENTGEVQADQVSAEFRFANWGMPAGPGQMPWDLPTGITTNPTTPPKNVAVTNGTAELTAQWPRALVDGDYKNHSHQCMVVSLSSPMNVNFNQAAVRRNMDFVKMSEVERDAEISGEGYPEPADGSGELDFLLQTFCRRINVAERLDEREGNDPEVRALIQSAIAVAYQDGAEIPGGPNIQGRPASATAPRPSWKNSVVYVWVTIGSRRTGAFMKIGSNAYEILDEMPGEFGLVAYHEGLQDKFSFSFSGPGLVQYAPGSYGVKVPYKGRTVIKVKLTARPEGSGGDCSKLPRVPWPKPKPPKTVGPGPYGGGTTPRPKEGWLAKLLRKLGLKR